MSRHWSPLVDCAVHFVIALGMMIAYGCVCVSPVWGNSNVSYYFRNDLRGQANNYRGSQEREGKIISSFKDIVERKGDELIIKKKGEVLRIFKNIKKTRDGSITYYSLVDVNSKNKTLVVELGYDEGESYLLMNYDNGKDLPLGGIPYWSPNNKRFVVMNTGLSDFSPALVHIWKLEKGDFVREWQMVGYVANSGEWESDDHIHFVMLHMEAERFEGERKTGASPEEHWDCKFRPRQLDDKEVGWICRLETEPEENSKSPKKFTEEGEDSADDDN